MASPERADPQSDSDAVESSDDDERLFKFKSRGDFKRKQDSDDDDDDDGDDEDGMGNGKDDDDGGSDSDDGDDAFNSSPEVSRVRRTTRGDTAGEKDTDVTGSSGLDLNMLSSDDDDNCKPPPPKRRRELDDAALKAKAEALIEESLLDDDYGSGQGIESRKDAKREADREYARKMKAKLDAASTINTPPGGGSGRYATSRSNAIAAAAKAAEHAREAAKDRARRELAMRRATLTVIRSRAQRHIFKTKLGTMVGAIEKACRGEMDLLAPGEENASLSLHYEGKELSNTCALMDVGIKGDANLRLEVKSKAGGAASFSGPPISLKVRTHGGKTFKVEITTDMKFSVFMASFNAAVGIPPDRAGESVFEFDGSKLSPTGTAEDEDMDDEELVDAKLPADLMVGVQAAPSTLNLIATAQKMADASAPAATTTSSSSSSSSSSAPAPAPAPASAVDTGTPGQGTPTGVVDTGTPAENAGSRRASAVPRATRSGTRSSTRSRSTPKAAPAADEIIVLD